MRAIDWDMPAMSCDVLHCAEHVTRNGSEILELARLANCSLESKICKHWKILLFMACLRKAAVFDAYTVLDEIIWTGYAAFIDD